MHMRKFLLGFAALLCFVIAKAQTTTVTGKVTDEKGRRKLPALLLLKRVPRMVPQLQMMVHSPVGKAKSYFGNYCTWFDSKEVKATDNLAITLNPDTKALSEVVVTGVGTATSKKKLGISVESITGDKLPSIPTASLDQAIIGKIPGPKSLLYQVTLVTK